MTTQRGSKLLTASDVAELCEVDLKTIHNWAERGCVPYFRTPGRHLRFRAADVAGFLREWGYAIPRAFYRQLAHTVIVVGNDGAAPAVKKALGEGCAVRSVDDLYDALLLIGGEPTSALVLEDDVVSAHADVIDRVLQALKKAYDIRVVVIGDSGVVLSDPTLVSVVPANDLGVMREALTAGSGREEQPPPSAQRRRRSARNPA